MKAWVLVALLCAVATGEQLFGVLRSCATATDSCSRVGTSNATIVTFDSTQPQPYQVLNTFQDLFIVPGVAIARPAYDPDNNLVWCLLMRESGGSTIVTLVAFNSQGQAVQRFPFSQWQSTTLVIMQYDVVSKSVLVYGSTIGFNYISTKDGSIIKVVTAKGYYNVVAVDTQKRQMYFTAYSNHRSNVMVNGLVAVNIDTGLIATNNVTFNAPITDNLYAQVLQLVPNTNNLVGMYQLSGFLSSFTVVTDSSGKTARVVGNSSNGISYVPFIRVGTISTDGSQFYSSGQSSDGSTVFATVDVQSGSLVTKSLTLSGSTGYMTGITTLGSSW